MCPVGASRDALQPHPSVTPLVKGCDPSPGCGSRRCLWKWLFTCSAESQGAEEGEELMAPVGVFPQGTVTHLSPRPARRGCAAPFCKHTQPLGTPKVGAWGWDLQRRQEEEE